MICAGSIVTNGHAHFRVWAVMNGWAWVQRTDGGVDGERVGPLTFRVSDLQLSSARAA